MSVEAPSLPITSPAGEPSRTKLAPYTPLSRHQGMRRDDAILTLRPWEREIWRWVCSWLPAHRMPALPSPSSFLLCSGGAPSACQGHLHQSRTPGEKHRSQPNLRQQQKGDQRSLGLRLVGSEKQYQRRPAANTPTSPPGFASPLHFQTEIYDWRSLVTCHSTSQA